MAEEENRSLYNEHVEKIIDHYDELVEHTRRTLFPWWEFHIVEKPNTRGMRKFPAVLAEILAPYIVIDKDFFSLFRWKKILPYALWLYVFMLWVALLSFWAGTLDQTNATSANAASTPLSLWSQLLTYIIVFLPPILIYGYTVWFLITRRTPWKTRVVWWIVLLVLVLIYYLYSQNQQGAFSEIVAVVNSPLFKPLLFLIIVPVILFMNYSVIYYGKLLIELTVNLLNSFIYANQPVSYRTLRQVVTNPIESEKAGWRLSDVDEKEIKTLKELASNNLEASEKKTIPVVILIAVIAFLASLPVFQQFFGNVIQEAINRILEILVLTRNAANMTFGRIVFDMAIFLAITLIVAANVYLFQNLLIQGIIVQACTVAEYAKSQSVSMISQGKKSQSVVYMVLKQVVGLIDSIFRK